MSERMRFSLEIPTLLLHELAPLTDFDFALAHRVLEDEAYANFYADRGPRKLLLDNSMHELGRPLPIDRLRAAAERVNANYVIAPDLLDDPDWTLKQYVETVSKLGSKFWIAPVLSGTTPEARTRFLKEIGSSQNPGPPLCLPYRKPRFSWFLEQFPEWPWIHLLGMSSRNELRTWVNASQTWPGTIFSVDTSKPIKAALVGRRINDGESLRGIPISSKDLLGRGATRSELALIKENVTTFKTWLQP